MKLERKITILPHTAKDFIIPWNGKFDMNRAMMYGGLMAGECYESEGFDKLVNENPSKTINRGNRTAISEHYTTHEHIHIGLEIVNFSKSNGNFTAEGKISGLKYLGKHEKIVKRLFR